MDEFFAFYWAGILKILNWFTDPVHLFGLFVFGFFAITLLGFIASVSCSSEPDDVPSTVWGVLFLFSLVIFVFLGFPFLIFLNQ